MLECLLRSYLKMCPYLKNIQDRRWVKDGHKTQDLAWSTFVGVVSWDSVRITLAYVVLNGLDVKAADIQNTYLQAPV